MNLVDKNLQTFLDLLKIAIGVKADAAFVQEALNFTPKKNLNLKNLEEAATVAAMALYTYNNGFCDDTASRHLAVYVKTLGYYGEPPNGSCLTNYHYKELFKIAYSYIICNHLKEFKKIKKIFKSFLNIEVKISSEGLGNNGKPELHFNTLTNYSLPYGAENFFGIPTSLEDLKLKNWKIPLKVGEVILYRDWFNQAQKMEYKKGGNTVNTVYIQEDNYEDLEDLGILLVRTTYKDENKPPKYKLYFSEYRGLRNLSEGEKYIITEIMKPFL